MTPANYISIVNVMIAVLALLVTVIVATANKRSASKKETKEEVAEQTAVMIELKNISSGISDIKKEINDIKSDTKEHTKKLIELEQSQKSEHKRIDVHEDRIKSLEELLMRNN